VFLDSDEAIQNAIRYVEENPEKEGKPRQHGSFVQPYADGCGLGHVSLIIADLVFISPRIPVDRTAPQRSLLARTLASLQRHAANSGGERLPALVAQDTARRRVCRSSLRCVESLLRQTPLRRG